MNCCISCSPRIRHHEKEFYIDGEYRIPPGLIGICTETARPVGTGLDLRFVVDVIAIKW